MVLTQWFDVDGWMMMLDMEWARSQEKMADTRYLRNPKVQYTVIKPVKY